ncbi:MAG TPA: hypothetical protein VGF75_07815 [Candidatus Saccharimonadales bacterium]|jgi:hypothetical protein
MWKPINDVDINPASDYIFGKFSKGEDSGVVLCDWIASGIPPERITKNASGETMVMLGQFTRKDLVTMNEYATHVWDKSSNDMRAYPKLD